MKKFYVLAKILFLFFAVVSLGLVTVSCSDDDDTVKAIESIAIDPDIETILTALLEQKHPDRYDYNRDSLFVINSNEEFCYYFGSDEGVDIDFGKYTLLCGWLTTYSSPTTIKSQSLSFNKNKNLYTYNIVLNIWTESYQVISNIYFCALYNKLNKKVELKVKRVAI